MPDLPSKLDDLTREAVARFWSTRDTQAARQGQTGGQRDAGARTAVTGGAQMDGFVDLLKYTLSENKVPDSEIFTKRDIELPGWFRAEKQWDVVVVSRGELLLAVELKSQVGPSFGNNFNNRTEEALGSATDIWAAYREGAFRPSARPWLGYFMLLERVSGSMRPVRVCEPHFQVFPEFRDTSYSQRYELLLTKLVRERLYDAACLLLSDPVAGPQGTYEEPSEAVDPVVSEFDARKSAERSREPLTARCEHTALSEARDREALN